MFKYFNHLGYNNPYYSIYNGKFEIHSSFPGILNKQFEILKPDPIAVIELINKGFILADRTLVQNIQKIPWLAKPNNEMDNWVFAEAPEHGFLKQHEGDIAEKLFQKLCNEIEIYVGSKNKIGLLLSGGMDSRIVAGAIDYLIKTGKLKNIKVTGLTWGNDNTRDVVYAKEIARRLGWKWKHYEVNAMNLMNNMIETAVNGCEYSPFHLHAIPQIRDDNNDIEAIIAGSYGDSIGRAEYSGDNVRWLRPLKDGITNVGRIIHKDIYKRYSKQIFQDIRSYQVRFPRNELYMQNELDYQLHYMRRMLNACMQLLTQKIEFYQAFTHPAVFGYMWSIHPERRNDGIYKNMLSLFKTNLNDIPWARTGLPFGNAKGTPDKLLKEHHNYPQQINHILLEHTDLNRTLYNLKGLGIFNIDAVKTLFKLMRRRPASNMFFLERILWLLSLSKLCELYDIKGIQHDERPKRNYSIPFVTHFEYLKTNTLISGKKFIKEFLIQ